MKIPPAPSVRKDTLRSLAIAMGLHLVAFAALLFVVAGIESSGSSLDGIFATTAARPEPASAEAPVRPDPPRKPAEDSWLAAVAEGAFPPSPPLADPELTGLIASGFPSPSPRFGPAFPALLAEETGEATASEGAREDSGGEPGWVGVRIHFDERFGRTRLLEVLPDGPALRQGVLDGRHVGLAIVGVDGVSVTTRPFPEILRMLHGPPNTKVRIDLQPIGASAITSVVVRRDPLPTRFLTSRRAVLPGG